MSNIVFQPDSIVELLNNAFKNEPQSIRIVNNSLKETAFDALCMISSDNGIVSIVDTDETYHWIKESSMELVMNKVISRLETTIRKSIKSNNVVIMIDQTFYDLLEDLSFTPSGVAEYWCSIC